jgi:peptidoglycan hydrolase-like protein with peptidoglycan-binding domain
MSLVLWIGGGIAALAGYEFMKKPKGGAVHKTVTDTGVPIKVVAYPGHGAIVGSPTGYSNVSLQTVKDVQRALNTLGYVPTLKVDGFLGPKTTANVRVYQSKNGLVVDGSAGDVTMRSLSASLAKMAASGSALHQAVALSPDMAASAGAMTSTDIQTDLNILGARPPLQVDGIIGPKSRAAIIVFQTTHGLQVDGIAGPLTKAAIYTAVHSPHPIAVQPQTQLVQY